MTLITTLQMDDVFGEVVQSMPVQLVEPVERMINRDVRYRPTMQYFMSVSVLLWAPAQRKRATMLYFADVYLFIYFFLWPLRPWLTEVRENFTRGRP